METWADEDLEIRIDILVGFTDWTLHNDLRSTRRYFEIGSSDGISGEM